MTAGFVGAVHNIQFPAAFGGNIFAGDSLHAVAGTAKPERLISMISSSMENLLKVYTCKKVNKISFISIHVSGVYRNGKRTLSEGAFYKEYCIFIHCIILIQGKMSWRKAIWNIF